MINLTYIKTVFLLKCMQYLKIKRFKHKFYFNLQSYLSEIEKQKRK